MATGEPRDVVDRLLEMKERAQVDELVVVTPSLDRKRRIESCRALADAWRAAA
jgi:alkanesulfonate monooxygenase SsuD/methylene tetrahydromethanopterin reductase-like flavin-dependent oxidoreductase (luciferase family)